MYIERPDVLSEAQRRSGERAIARRLTGQMDRVPWLTFDKAIDEIEELLASASGDAERQLLGELREHLDERREQAVALLCESD